MGRSAASAFLTRSLMIVPPPQEKALVNREIARAFVAVRVPRLAELLTDGKDRLL